MQVAVSVASVAQAVAAVAAIAAVVGGGGVQSWSSHNSGRGMVDGSGMHHGVCLGGHLVGVGIGRGHRVDGLHDRGVHNGRGVALDNWSMRDDGRSIGGAVAESIGGDDASVGNGAQGREYSDLQDKTMISLKLLPASSCRVSLPA